jgi:hypothetical protein
VGSSAERKKVGDAIQARRAARGSGTTGTFGIGEAGAGGAGGGGAERRAELVVPLVRISREVLTRSTVGESVRLHEQGGTIAVLSSIGQLGEIPPGYLEKVQTSGYAGGIITELRLDPLSVKVSLS